MDEVLAFSWHGSQLHLVKESRCLLVCLFGERGSHTPSGGGVQALFEVLNLLCAVLILHSGGVQALVWCLVFVKRGSHTPSGGGVQALLCWSLLL